MSKYCLQHSPVPVIVVRPSSKRDKKKAKRKADPGRKVYQEMLHNSDTAFTNHGNHSRKSVSGVIEAMSNTSISSMGEPISQNSPGGDISPKTSAPANGGGGNSPASESPTPGSESFGDGGGARLDDVEEVR